MASCPVASWLRRAGHGEVSHGKLAAVNWPWQVGHGKWSHCVEMFLCCWETFQRKKKKTQLPDIYALSWNMQLLKRRAMCEVFSIRTWTCHAVPFQHKQYYAVDWKEEKKQKVKKIKGMVRQERKKRKQLNRIHYNSTYFTVLANYPYSHHIHTCFHILDFTQ